MTPAPEKAAPIPAEVLAKQYAAKACVGAWTVEEAVLNAILADREARPSLPDSREEQIRAEAAENERDRLLLAAHESSRALADGQWVRVASWLIGLGARLPADRARARARQGGNNG